MICKEIYLASDHAGFELKSFLIEQLSLDKSITIIDLGCSDSKTSVDYPDFANDLCQKLDDSNKFGILICGSGIGMSIAANRFKNIRAALCHDEEMAKLSRNHNNANILCLGARTLKNDKALDIVKKFFASVFEKGRHEIRIKKIT